MIKATCIQVIKDNVGRTVGFKLQDSTGKTNNFYEDALIKHIKSGIIEVDNLILNESYNTLVLTNNTNWHEVKISNIYELEKLNDLIGEMQSVRDKYFFNKENNNEMNFVETYIGHDTTEEFNEIIDKFNVTSEICRIETFKKLDEYRILCNHKNIFTGTANELYDLVSSNEDELHKIVERLEQKEEELHNDSINQLRVLEEALYEIKSELDGVSYNCKIDDNLHYGFEVTAELSYNNKTFGIVVASDCFYSGEVWLYNKETEEGTNIDIEVACFSNADYETVAEEIIEFITK